MEEIIKNDWVIAFLGVYTKLVLNENSLSTNNNSQKVEIVPQDDNR